MCLGNVSGDFSAKNMSKAGLSENVYDFSVNYNVIDISNIIDTHIHLMKKMV